MTAVRRALGALKELDLELWNEEHGPSVAAPIEPSWRARNMIDRQ